MAKKEAKNNRSTEEKPSAAKPSQKQKIVKGGAESAGSRSKNLNYIIAVLIIVAIGIGIYFVLSNYVVVPFSTFKSNFDSAQRVAIAISYRNTSQYTSESVCIPIIMQYIAHTRNASTIDFFIINQENSTCFYQLGLGMIHLQSGAASQCVARANSEPGVFLNYSSVNSTSVSLNHLYVYGNSDYMRKCSIAPDMS